MRKHLCDYCGAEVSYNYLPGEYVSNRGHSPITIDIRRFSRDACIPCLISILQEMLPTPASAPPASVAEQAQEKPWVHPYSRVKPAKPSEGDRT